MELIWLTSPACWIPRIDSAETKQASATDQELRERLLDKLIEDRLLGSTRQTTELDPSSLPLRQLPPGNTASLYLMYLAFIRSSGGSPASRATFYLVSKSWYCCLRFRPRSEHSMCVICQSLKMAIHASTDTKIWFSKLPTFQVSVSSWRNLFFGIRFSKQVSLRALLRISRSTQSCATNSLDIIQLNLMTVECTGQQETGARIRGTCSAW